jgi:CBS domain-containing protein
MKVKDCMTRNVVVAEPQTPIREAAQMMEDVDAGILPVARDGQLFGVVTDRDMVVRGIARGLGPDATVEQVMSQDCECASEDDDLDDVAERMAELQVRRMPVTVGGGRLIGVISLADIVRSKPNQGPKQAGDALRWIAQPGHQHNP